MTHGSQGLFTQAGFNDPTQDESSQSHFGMDGPGSLQSQVFRNSCLLVDICYLLLIMKLCAGPYEPTLFTTIRSL